MAFKYLIIIIAFASIEINLTESRQSDKRRWKTDKSLYSHYVNICDIQDRVSKVHCYCENIKLKTATKADCWVFNGGIAEDDPFWSNFYSQPMIEKLSFNVRADGGLTYIPAKIIVRLERLQNLNIQYANIQNIPSFAFTNSTSLRDIMLPKNKIVKLERMSFAHLIMLSNVSLIDNQISELQRDIFYDLPNLQRLYLAKNKIEVIHEGCFKHLNNLIKLDLSSNLLAVVVRENFQGLSNLMNLDMRNNKLMMIGDLAFTELWSLHELYLDNNEIEFISERGFGGLTQLRKLSIADNKLASLDANVFNDIQKLYILDVRNNYLEYFKEETLMNLMENFKSNYALIALNGNKLTCDCSLAWLLKLRNETRSKRVKTALTRLSCISDMKPKSNGSTGRDKSNGHIYKNTMSLKNNIDKSYEETEGNIDDDTVYEDTMQDQDNEFNGNKIEYRRKLIDVPSEALPCPNRLSLEGSFSPPTQDEVKYYKSSASKVIVTVYLLLTILNITL
ncbi:PREDICTED: connectin-like [Papilio xuthus]|uniref:Connectin-like n=1 Tax=Papilio xuthus TaxID=66420 RepID=A0AAJ6ZHS0_PAPXU|nr:PREDICTED: connectin-like [Papilio xuthus]XP_013172783.1 PREDICTED: connectin-like [Papilio xuthus]